MGITYESLIFQLNALANRAKEGSNNLEVQRAGIVLFALIAALHGRRTMHLAGAAVAFTQLLLEDIGNGPR